MKYFLVGWLLALLPRVGATQGFAAPADMTPTVLHAYLARSITMASLVELKRQTLQNPSPAATAIYQRQITMLASLNARYIGRAIGMWAGEDHLPSLTKAFALMMDDIRAAYRKRGIMEMPIMEGAVFEIATATISGFRIPEDVWYKFSTAPYTGQVFDINEIGYTPQVSAGRLATEILPNMSREQTQMWFYYVATKYIEVGCEAIHFGQVELMGREDAGHAGWWKMLTAVRAYGATRNRGLVLCSAHTTSDLYYDPDPSHPLPAATHQRQLLFDLKAATVRMQEDLGKAWQQGGRGGGAFLDDKGANCSSSIFHSAQGGSCYLWGPVASLPFIVDVDNYGIGPTPGQAGHSCWIWGWDEITWFGKQLPAYRNQWLKYAYYRVQCLDPDGHLEMPGQRGMTEAPPAASRQYRASNGPEDEGNFNQETMIGNLWNGTYDHDWSYTNVTDAGLTTAPDPVLAAGSPVYVGENIYYIGADSRIHGYLKTSTGWLAVSPSYLAAAHNNQPLSAQQPAAGNLVASPDGTFLCYRGTDGELYKHDIGDGQRYPYSRLAASAPLLPAERVQSDLVCASPSRIYYRSASNELCGYLRQGGIWYPISPSCSASGAPARPVLLAGGLVADAAGTLYYRGSDGQLHGFAPLDASGWGYSYFDLPTLSATRVSGQLVAASNRLFYVNELDGRVYGLQRTTNQGTATAPAGHGRWVGVEGSWGAQLTPDGLPDQVPAAGGLAGSPDGRLLAYVGRDGALHGLRLTDATTTEYLDFAPPAPGISGSITGLRLRSATEFCYLAAASKLVVGELTGQVAACDNPVVAALQKPYDKTLAASRPILAPVASASLRYHLNPATANLQVELAGDGLHPATQAILQDALGHQVQAAPFIASDRPGVLAASLPMQQLLPGVYLLVATDDAGQRYTSRVAVPPAAN